MPAGQLSSSPAPLPVGGAGHATTLVFFNTDEGENKVSLFVAKSGSTPSQPFLGFTLGAGEQAILSGIPADVGGVVYGAATIDQTVKWTHLPAPDGSPFHLEILDAAGVPKAPAAAAPLP
jgi:hypothetical protein